jgi:5-methylcytosine-specific restriction protein B
MIDIQSLVWVIVTYGKEKPVLTKRKKDEFAKLYAEFVESYLRQEVGKDHARRHLRSREEGRRNFEEAVQKKDAGEDVTDFVLLKLLPHSDTPNNSERGAWVSVAPALKGDVKTKFEGADWAKAEDWPAISAAILDFVQRCQGYPMDLREACIHFANLPHSKGLKAGMLSPILNAVDPEKFYLVNNKAYSVVNHFAGTNYKQSILTYPDVLETQKRIIISVEDVLQQHETFGLANPDLFDMFTHWLNAEKKYFKKSKEDETKYWKIAPGPSAEQWDECLEEDCILIGWDDFNDISGLSKKEFDRLRDKLVAEKPEWTKSGASQVWKFARVMKIGDRVIANKGTSEVVGIGTIVGDYSFKPGAKRPHRRKVRWDDTTPRQINEGGWKKTLVKLSKEKFEEIAGISSSRGCPFNEQTFELLSGLHENPTLDFYRAHRDEFASNVEQPLQDLFAGVRQSLPKMITDYMETENKIFARILKNDFGKGGTWDFYWGAFYSKGGKRVEDAQLFATISRLWLDFGFFIGVYGSEQRKRFLRNCKEHYDALQGALAEDLSWERFCFGSRRESSDTPAPKPSLDWRAWLKAPEEHGVRVGMILDKEEVLSQSKDQLVSLVSSTFEKLFPLVLLAMLDNPIPKIAEYLGDVPEPTTNPPCTLKDCEAETGISNKTLAAWIRAIHRKGQAIIYGPPGTGKTYVAERLAKHLIAGGTGFKELVQFHPAYAYEDFIQGIRPETRPDGSLNYVMVPGRFLEFCQKAKESKDTCVLIIDEINRANLSRVFGELMYLLEYRDQEVPLAGGGTLQIPKNVRIIGTMNTADRSIALVDHALRRRFAFLDLFPVFDVLRKFHSDSSDLDIESLVKVLTNINNQINDPHYAVGISYFLQKNLSTQLEDIWKMEIQPYIEEYFFDQPDKAKEFGWDKIKPQVMP